MIEFQKVIDLFDVFATELGMPFIQEDTTDEKPKGDEMPDKVYGAYKITSEGIEDGRDRKKTFTTNIADITKTDIKTEKKSRPVISIIFNSKDQKDGKEKARDKANELLDLITDQDINEVDLVGLTVSILSPTVENRTTFLNASRGGGYEYKYGFDIVIDYCLEKVTTVEKIGAIQLTGTSQDDGGQDLPDQDIEIPVPLPGGNTAYQNKILGIGGVDTVCYYPKNESSGSAIIDLSGKMSNGLYVATSLAQALSPSGTLCPLYDGILSYGQLVASELDGLLDTQEFTVGYWMAPVLPWQNSGYTVTFSKDNATSNFYGHRIVQPNDGYQYVILQAGSLISLLPLAAVADASFKYIAYTFSKSNNRMRAYEDSIQVGTSTIPNNDNGISFTDFFIATVNSSLTDKFNGFISDLFIKNGESDLATIQAMGTP